MRVHLCQWVKVWERNCGEKFWPWHLWQCLWLPLWDRYHESGCSATDRGEERWSPFNSSICPAAPERTRAWAGSHLSIIPSTQCLQLALLGNSHLVAH